MVILGLLSLIFAVIIQAGTSGNPQISLNSPVSLPVDI